MDKKIIWIVFVPVVVIFTAYCLGLLYFIWPIDTKTLAQSGVFGDSFGVLTALFSALAFGGMIIAIYFQKRDLGLTQKELDETRIEMRRQHRENKIFQLLRLHGGIVDGLDVKVKKDNETVDVATGRDCFIRFYRKLSSRYSGKTRSWSGMEPAEKLRLSYQAFWKNWQKDLGHYFRTLYTIFIFLKESDFGEEDRKIYANIVRAQLSDYELIMIFYNCLSCHGENFRPLAEEFALFDNMPIELVFEESHLDPFSNSAFGANEKALTIKSSRPPTSAAD